MRVWVSQLIRWRVTMTEKCSGEGSEQLIVGVQIAVVTFVGVFFELVDESIYLGFRL